MVASLLPVDLVIWRLAKKRVKNAEQKVTESVTSTHFQLLCHPSCPVDMSDSSLAVSYHENTCCYDALTRIYTRVNHNAGNFVRSSVYRREKAL